MVRTTVTLDPEVSRLIEEAMRRERKSFKRTINEAIRRGLGPHRGRAARKPYRVTVHHARLAPGIDRRGLNRLADRLEDEALGATGRPRR